mgnify:CR=1 FL=1
MSKQICMLAHLYDLKRVIFPAYIQPKLDGVRAIWKHKEKRFVSRQNKPLAVPQHILDSIMGSPFDLDGELLIKGLPLNKISGAVRLQDVFNSRKEEIYYTIFDIFTDEKYPNRARKLFDYCNLNTKRNIINTGVVYNETEIQLRHKSHLSQGYEGSIIRNNSFYEYKRSFNLLKLKPRQRITCEVIGLLEGTGKYEGMLGALTIKTPQNKIFNVGTGFTDQERDYIWKNLILNHHLEQYNKTFVIIEFRDYSEYGIPIEASFKGFKE